MKKHQADDDEEPETSLHSTNSDPSLVPHSKMFAPKCLVLISKLDCFETFRVKDLISVASEKNMFFAKMASHPEVVMRRLLHFSHCFCLPSVELPGFDLHRIHRKHASSAGDTGRKYLGLRPSSTRR